MGTGLATHKSKQQLAKPYRTQVTLHMLHVFWSRFISQRGPCCQGLQTCRPSTTGCAPNATSLSGNTTTSAFAPGCDATPAHWSRWLPFRFHSCHDMTLGGTRPASRIFSTCRLPGLWLRERVALRATLCRGHTNRFGQCARHRMAMHGFSPPAPISIQILPAPPNDAPQTRL